MSTALTSGVLSGAIFDAVRRYASRRTRKWAEADAKDRGEFRGKGSYEETGRPDWYRVSLDLTDPLRLYSFETRHEYRTSFVFECDLGSVPDVVQGAGGGLLKLKPTDFWRSYGLHDDGYRLGGLFIRDPAKTEEWTFVRLDRVHVDVVLLWGLSAEGANNATLQAVYRAVRLGAAIPWRRHRADDPA